jgi:hypothetical protein
MTGRSTCDDGRARSAGCARHHGSTCDDGRAPNGGSACNDRLVCIVRCEVIERVVRVPCHNGLEGVDQRTRGPAKRLGMCCVMSTSLAVSFYQAAGVGGGSVSVH